MMSINPADCRGRQVAGLERKTIGGLKPWDANEFTLNRHPDHG